MSFSLTSLKKLLFAHLIFLIPLALFGLLLFRNPFSVRTQIPNLEPFPDSFHYLDPAMTFLQGKGFFIEREGRTIKPSVPPLYSLALAPMFLVIPDIRAFYFVNLFLAFVAFTLYYQIIRRLFPQKSVQLLLLVLYVTSFPIHWFPTLAMAENLILPLYLGAILLLIFPSTWKTAILAGFISMSFYATKYASLPLTAIFPILFGLKILADEKNPSHFFATLFSSQVVKSKKVSMFQKFHSLQQRTFSYLTSLIFFVGLYLMYEYIAKGNNVIGNLLGLTQSVFFPKPAVLGAGGGGGEFFGTNFIAKNITMYTRWLVGFPLQTLWKQIVILPQILAIPAMLGLVSTLTYKQHRFIGLCLILFLVSVISFMMVFYAYDGRYFIIAIPTIFLGLGFFFASISTILKRFSVQKIASVVAIFLVITYVGVIATQLKFWVGLNLKYSETPWYYISIKTFDSYLHEHKQEFKKTPIIISALPPYMIDYYAKETMTVLPLSTGQEFRSYLKQAWGDYNYKDLQALYTNFILEGHPVFLTQYGLGNEKYLQDAFATTLKAFDTVKVVSGCHNLCDVYQLSVKGNAVSRTPFRTQEALRN